VTCTDGRNGAVARGQRGPSLARSWWSGTRPTLDETLGPRRHDGLIVCGVQTAPGPDNRQSWARGDINQLVLPPTRSAAPEPTKVVRLANDGVRHRPDLVESPCVQESSGVRVEERICSSCRRTVTAGDAACRHCGARFDAVIRPSGSLLHDFFRLLLGFWALSLPVLCLWVGLTSPQGWGDLAAYLTSYVYFVPWIVGIISLSILTWLTEERR
jgi:hypothetical protein